MQDLPVSIPHEATADKCLCVTRAPVPLRAEQKTVVFAEGGVFFSSPPLDNHALDSETQVLMN